MLNYRESIEAAKSLEDIKNVFQNAFFGKIDIDTSEYGIKVRGKKARERLNAQAREILERVNRSEDLKPEDIEILKQYSGRGGTSDNSQFEYYTPQPIAEGAWDLLKANGFENGNMLDPSSGSGIFSATKPNGVVITGCDIDPTSSKVASLLHPGDSIKNEPFEKLVIDTPDNTFDGCITNVPFGDARGRSVAIDRDMQDNPYGQKGSIQKYFLFRIMDKIKPGKLAVLICPTNVLDGKGGGWERFRRAVSLKAEFLGAHKLPSGTFSGQGTDTVVDVLIFKKHPADLLAKINDLAEDVLENSQVVWPEFVEGHYWKGEGRPFIHGKFIPKDPNAFRSVDKVDGGGITNEALKQRLAHKFNSRIDWDSLDVAEPVVVNYAEGDRRIINQAEYELIKGQWRKVAKADHSHALDKDKFGASSLAELKGLLGSDNGALSLSVDQAFSAFKAYPGLLSGHQKAAVEFAMSQPKQELASRLYRGSLIGGMINDYRMAVESGTEDNDRRTFLQELVVNEIDRYGHPKKNKGLVLTGDTSREFGVFMSSVDDNGNFSELLSGTVIDKSLKFDPSNALSTIEHLYHREGIQNIFLEDFVRIYSGDRKIENLGDIADVAGIAITPDGTIMPMAAYCSGEIFPKIVAMSEAIAGEEDPRLIQKFQEQIDYIEAKRSKTASEDVSFGLQEKWFPPKYIAEFLKENGYPDTKYGRMESVVKKDPMSGEEFTTEIFVEDIDGTAGIFVEISKGNKRAGFPWQLQQFVNGEKVKNTEDNSGINYRDKVKDLQDMFQAWMQQRPEIDELTDLYNQKFNSHLPFEEPTDDLEIEGVSPERKLHWYQNQAIRKASAEGHGVIGLAVGLGKTMTALGLHAYNRKMGRGKKTCYIVPNSVLSNWYHEANAYFGNMNGILVVSKKAETDKDGKVKRLPVLDEAGNPKKNKYTGKIEYQDSLKDAKSSELIWGDMWDAASNEYHVVVMSYEQFGSLPVRPSTVEAFAESMKGQQLLSLKQSDTLKKEGKSYAEDVKDAKSDEKFFKENTQKKGQLPYFEDMGFDNLIVDELHNFRNLFQPEKEQSVAYLPVGQDAKRAMDLAIKTFWMRHRYEGRGVYGLSATPVVNSPVELFNILSFMISPKEFEKFGVYTLDDFIRVFGEIEKVEKANMAGDVKSVDGLVGFKKLSGLRGLIAKHMDIRTAKDVDPNGELIRVPEKEEVDDLSDMTPEQEVAYDELREMFKEAVKPQRGGPKKINPLSVLRMMDRATTDIDMYHKLMTFHFPQTKMAAVVKAVKSLDGKTAKTKQFDEKKKKQEEVIIVFTHVSKTDGKTYIVQIPDAFEQMLLEAVRENGIDQDEVTHPITPKYAKLISRCKEFYAAGGKQIIFTEEKTQHAKIARILAHSLKIPGDEIALINADDAKGDRLQQVSDSYNSGKVKFVIANRKAEVGVNLQKGTSAIHHLTLPWTPASLEQRNGRGVRQGNTVEKVQVFYYLAAKSIDYYRLDIIRGKARWLDPLYSKTGAERMDNGQASADNDIIDILSSDPEEAKRRRMEQIEKKAKAQAEKERADFINKLQVIASNAAFVSAMDAKKGVERTKLQDDIAKLEKSVAKYKADGLNLEGEERAALGKKLIEASARLDGRKADLATIEDRYAKRKKNAETLINQNSGLLKQAAKKGKLPFDVALVDNPGNAMVIGSLVVAVGDAFEQKDNSSVIFKITAVNPELKGFDYENIIGYFSVRETVRDEISGKRFYNAAIFKWNEYTKVALSDSELEVKQKLSKYYNYRDFISGKLSKEIFFDHAEKVKFDGGLYWEGAELVYGKTGADPKTLAWPEPDNEVFRKAAFSLYMKYRKEKSYFPGDHIYSAMFGSDWGAKAISEFGTILTEAEIRTECVSRYNELIVEYFGKEPSLDEMADRNGFSSYELSAIMRKIRAGLSEKADNENDIRRITDEYVSGKSQELSEYRRKLADKRAFEAKAEEEKRLREDPNFKEVPQELAEKFLAIGITAIINTSSTQLDGKGRYRGANIPAFNRWFLQDKYGKNGILYRTKEILKSRHSATFCTGTINGRSGAWWHVPATEDLEKIYELIAS